MPLAGVVLAAGRSARMGTPKALLDFRGAPFVVRILERLSRRIECQCIDRTLCFFAIGSDCSVLKKHNVKRLYHVKKVWKVGKV